MSQGVVAVVANEGRLLVIRRSRFVKRPGCYCFPGGGIEEGESEEVALVRELREELNVGVRPLRRLWTNTTPWHVKLAWWSAELSTDSPITPNQAEVESVHWYRPVDLWQLSNLLESNLEFLQAWQRGAFELQL